MIVMVLNDGETWTSIEGCEIHEVKDDFDLDNGDEFTNETFRSRFILNMGLPLSVNYRG